MKGQFMLISAIVGSLIVMSTASVISEAQDQDFSPSDTGYYVNMIDGEAEKYNMEDAGERRKFEQQLSQVPAYSIQTDYWAEKTCYNITLKDTSTSLRVTEIGICNQPMDSEIVEYDFDGSGQEVTDSGDLQNHGTLGNDTEPRSHDPQRINDFDFRAMKFDGQDDFVQKDPESTINVESQTEITVATWAKIEETGNDINKAVFKDGAFNLQPQFESQGETKIRAEVYTENGGWSDNQCVTSNGQTELGEWAHYAMTWDGQTITIYKNGKSVEKCSVSGRFKDSADTPICVGAGFCDSGSGQHHTDGSLDKVRVYSKAFTPKQVRQMYSYR